MSVVCVYVCVCVSVRVCVCECVRVCAFAYVHGCVHAHVSTYTYVRYSMCSPTCECTCVYTRMCLRECASVCVLMAVCASVCVCVGRVGWKAPPHQRPLLPFPSLLVCEWYSAERLALWMIFSRGTSRPGALAAHQSVVSEASGH